MSEEPTTGEFEAAEAPSKDAGRVKLDYVQEYDQQGALGDSNRGLQFVLLIIAAILAFIVMVGGMYLILPGVFEA